MPKSVWLRSVSVVMAALWLAAPAVAKDEALQQAIDLFAAQKYDAAQEALAKVDADKLTAEEKARFDELKRVLPEALAGVRQAGSDLAAANKAFDEGRWDEAARLYQAVSQNGFATTAQSTEAEMQLGRVREKQGAATPVEGAEEAAAQPPARGEAQEGPTRVTPTDVMRQRDRLLWGRAVAKAEELAKQARAAATENRYTEAFQLADEAIQQIESARSYSESAADYQKEHDAAIALRGEIERGAEAYGVTQTEKEQQEIAERVRRRKELIEQQRAEKIQQLFNTAAQLRQERRFNEAAEVLRQILHIDPANAKARYQLEIAEDYSSLAEQAAWHDDLVNQDVIALRKADEALIPWDYEVLYPRNWVELTAKRSTAGVGPGGRQEGDSELNRKLKEPLGDIRFEDQPFDQIVNFLQEITKVNISVDWEDLNANGIAREKSVTVKLSNLSFKTVLVELLSQVGGDVKLAYSLGEGLIRIATKEKLDKDKLVLVYDIRDLLIDVPRFSARPSLDPSQALQQQGQGSGGTNLFQNQEQDDELDRDRGQERGETTGVVARIMDIIRQTVEPDSWRETGGGDGSLRELNGQLIVYNTSDAQRQVVDLLNQLRASQSLQIAVEARFLSVTSNFLEQFGVDLDFVFNSGNAGYDRATNVQGQPLIDPVTGSPILMPRQYSSIGAVPASPPFGTPLPPVQGLVPAQPYGSPGLVPQNTSPLNDFSPISAQQGSLQLVNPATVNTNVPGSWAQRADLAPALNIAGSFLDNLQVDFLIRATQANRRSSIVQAPRLVLFNGQRSRIQIGRARQYVSSVQPTVAEGAVGVQPIISTASSGSELIVDGTISADRKYVTLTIIATEADEPRFERFEVQRPSGNSPGIFILLPDQSFATIRTTVSVPDGGTVLLGGLKQVGEEELEAGVPILSKIPVLKRAFENRTTVKDTRTILILMKAKIIIQKEAEEEAFPTLSSAGG
jgi:general secretion pathway protein D